MTSGLRIIGPKGVVSVSALALGLAAVACSSEPAVDTSATSSLATTTRPTTTTAAPTTTLSSEETCLSFRDEIVPLIDQAANQLSEYHRSRATDWPEHL